jgi:cytochrome c peroxidase
MRSKPLVILLVALATVLGGLAVAAVSRESGPKLVIDTEHGRVQLADGEQARVLRAATATAGSTPPAELVANGRRMFRDAGLYEAGESCQGCHTEGAANGRLGQIVHDERVDDADFTPKPDPMPPADFNGPRDAPALWDLAKTPPYFWDGDVPTLEAALIRPVKGHFKSFVPGGAKGTPDCETAAQAAEKACTDLLADAVAALEAYVLTLHPPRAAFDQGTLSQQALRGERLFQAKGGCIGCHGGPQFTDNNFHNVGVPLVSFTSPYRADGGPIPSNDDGAGPPPLPTACGQNPAPAGCEPLAPPFDTTAFINTPSLRDARNTAPYFHNDAFKTLHEVVQFYDSQSAIAPLNLTGQEIDDLVAYLESL